ncbi:hypothetical protein [Streptomyces yerevanensis]|uniref:hypothetical protein n=1 Tax=Streptomyces yerevanensis TaxID=66378 RepID=UPI001B80406C|nr:hypothetical protein [Streptomyces yerevanensis]
MGRSRALAVGRHLLGWRRTPSPAAIGRAPGAVDGDAPDRAVAAYLADRHHATDQHHGGIVGVRTRSAGQVAPG